MRGTTMVRRAVMAAAMTAVAAVLALPGGAAAGGFATVGLSSLPDGTPPGTPWHVTLTILQHGRTPLADLQPAVSIRSADGKTTRTFPAKPAGKAGLYTADVVFPSAGRWRYTVADGFSQTHRFAPVAIGSSRSVPIPGSRSGAGPAGAQAPTTRDGGNVGAALGAAVVAGLLAGLLAFALLRRRTEAAAAPR
jgi:hypothetical protein